MKEKIYPPLLVIVGTTASGKSDLAIEVAEKMQGEVISADSRQIYRHLDQTTGKVTEKETRGIPHHMLDIIEPGEIYSAHQYAEKAISCIENIYSQGKVPIIAGGTGFYIDAVLFEGVTAEVPADPLFRKKKERKPLPELQQELREKDKNAYDRIDIKNPRRLIRALEIIREHGILPLQKRKKRYRYHMIGIRHSRPHLREKIITRLNDRFEGMKQEIQNLLNKGVQKEWFKKMGLECRYIALMLTEHRSEKKTRENLAKAIFAYAKRQETWLKRYPEAVWYRENERAELHADIGDLYNGACDGAPGRI